MNQRDSMHGRRSARRTQFNPGVAAAYTFVLGAFVWPGVYGAVTGAATPAPSYMGSWAAWIVRWIGVTVVGYTLAAVTLRILERRRKRDR